MNEVLVDKLLTRYRVHKYQKKYWIRLLRWINSFIVFQKNQHDDEDILEWDGNSVKIFSNITKELFFEYLTFSIIFLAQEKDGKCLSREDFCKKNFLREDGIENIPLVVKSCQKLFSHGTF